MIDKEIQVEEIQRLLIKYFRLYGYKLPDEVVELVACDFYENNIRKLQEDSMVLSGLELADYKHYKEYTKSLAMMEKETAKKIFAELFYIASIHHSDVANILAWAKDKAKQFEVKTDNSVEHKEISIEELLEMGKKRNELKLAEKITVSNDKGNVNTKEQIMDKDIRFKYDDEEISFTKLFSIFFSLSDGEKLVVEDVNPIGIIKVKKL